MIMETRLRSLIKAVTYRILGSLVTAALVLFLTHRKGLALSAGILDSVTKVLAYFVHERLWAKIPYGRVEAGLVEAASPAAPSAEPVEPVA